MVRRLPYTFIKAYPENCKVIDWSRISGVVLFGGKQTGDAGRKNNLSGLTIVWISNASPEGGVMNEINKALSEPVTPVLNTPSVMPSVVSGFAK